MTAVSPGVQSSREMQRRGRRKCSGYASVSTGVPPPSRRARRAAAAAAAKHSAGAAAAGARGEEEQQAARLRTAVLRGYLAVSSVKLRATGVLYVAELAAGG